MKKSDFISYILIAVIFLGGIYFWSHNLERDPTMYYSGLGQSLSTDTSHYVYHARQKILFDDFDTFDYPRWTVFQHSLTSFTAYLWFQFVNVSYQNSNAIGVFLSLSGLLFFILGLLKHHHPLIVAIIALLFIINITLITHGKQPYLENGLIFWIGLLFFVLSRWSHTKIGIVCLGIITTMAMLTGKLFGLLLLPAIILTILVTHEKKKYINSAIVLISFIASFLIIAYLLYGSNISSAFGYVSEQSYSLRGFPEGLTSPITFFEYLISFGYINRLFYINIDLVIMMLLGLFILIQKFSNVQTFKSIPKTTLFSFFWILFGIVGLSPINYTPIRYAIFIIPAIIIFSITIFETALTNNTADTIKKEKKYFILFMFFLWHALFQIIAVILYENEDRTEFLTWVSLPIAIVATFLIMKIFEKFPSILNRNAIKVMLTGVVLFSVGLNLFHIKDRLLKENNHDIVEASEDIGKILGDNAVLSGSYAPLLTMENNLHSFIFQFGLIDNQQNILSKYPITHLALDESSIKKAISLYPAFKDIPPIATYWIRDYEIKLYNISKFFNNQTAHQYQETAYEKAMIHFAEAKYESSYEFLSQFLKMENNSKSANMLLANILLGYSQFDEATKTINNLAKTYPTDFNIQLFCGRTMQIIELRTQKPNNAFREYYDKAVALNRYRLPYIRIIINQTEKQFQP